MCVARAAEHLRALMLAGWLGARLSGALAAAPRSGPRAAPTVRLVRQARASPMTEMAHISPVAGTRAWLLLPFSHLPIVGRS